MAKPEKIGPKQSLKRHYAFTSSFADTGDWDCGTPSEQSCHTTHVRIVTRHTGSAVTIVAEYSVSPQTLHRSYLCRYLPLSLLDGPHTQAGVSDIVECDGE